MEDLVKNHDLLAKVMSHYRNRLELLHEDRQIRSVMSNAMRENVAFNHTIKQIEQLLSIKGEKATEEAKAHSALLTNAISLYARDLEDVFKRAKNLLPDLPNGDLQRLETELREVKGYLTR